MLHISAIPPYLWCMQLLPSAIAVGYVAVRRKWSYAPILFFSLTTVVVSSAESVYNIFVLGRLDEKFRHTPNTALEIALFGDAIIGFIGLFFFGSVFAYCAGHGRRVTARSIIVAAFFGGIYETLPDQLYWWRVKAPSIAWWIWILLMPVAAALFTVRQMAQSQTERAPVIR